MKILDLFSGIGGFSLGLESTGGFETVAFCERDPFCQKVLEKHWPDVPIHGDITKLNGSIYNDSIDIICGGFPCQPFSSAGHRRGKEDNRDLWPEMFRIIQEAKPAWIIGENATGFVNMELERTALDLESEGYEVQAFIIPACGVGAPHRRYRVFIIANSPGFRRDDSTIYRKHYIVEATRQPRGSGCEARTSANVDDFTSEQAITAAESFSAKGHARREYSGRARGDVTCANGLDDFSKWRGIKTIEEYFTGLTIPKPTVRRGDDGFPGRMDRLKSLGNAVIPQIVAEIGKAILEVEKDYDIDRNK